KKYGLISDPALVLLGRIVNGADTDNTLYQQPEGPGLEAIAEGFRHLGYPDDHALNAAEWIVYDALYAYCREMVRQGKPKGDFVQGCTEEQDRRWPHGFRLRAIKDVSGPNAVARLKACRPSTALLTLGPGRRRMPRPIVRRRGDDPCAITSRRSTAGLGHNRPVSSDGFRDFRLELEVLQGQSPPAISQFSLLQAADWFDSWPRPVHDFETRAG